MSSRHCLRFIKVPLQPQVWPCSNGSLSLKFAYKAKLSEIIRHHLQPRAATNCFLKHDSFQIFTLLKPCSGRPKRAPISEASSEQRLNHWFWISVLIASRERSRRIPLNLIKNQSNESAGPAVLVVLGKFQVWIRDSELIHCTAPGADDMAGLAKACSSWAAQHTQYINLQI